MSSLAEQIQSLVALPLVLVALIGCSSGTLSNTTRDAAFDTLAVDAGADDRGPAITDASPVNDAAALVDAAEDLPVSADGPVPDAQAGCGPGAVTVLPPATGFASTVASHPAGTCFELAAGSYDFHGVQPKDNMRFFGASNTAVVVDGSGHESAFFGNAKNVTIADMDLKNFDNLMGQIAQEQAPIRGNTGLWHHDPGQHADGWIIERMVIHDNPASGIIVGDHFIVRHNLLYNNTVTGIGGGRFFGGLIENNELHHNGSQGAAGAGVNNAAIKIAFAHGDAAGPVTVRGNKIHDNGKRGIWCDLDCNDVLFENNTITNHTHSGIFVEISRNAIVRGNTLVNCNDASNFTLDWNPGAITVAESGHVLLEQNTISNNVAGVALTETKRPAPGESWLQGQVDAGNVPNLTLNNVTVKDNVFTSNQKVGASHGPSGAGLADYGSIVFVGNSYDLPLQMEFWWQAQQKTWAEWQALGHQ